MTSLADSKLALIASRLSPAQLLRAKDDISARLPEPAQQELHATPDNALIEELCTRWKLEFRRHLLSEYTDNLSIALDEAVSSFVSDSSSTIPQAIEHSRTSVSRSRMKAGRVFAAFGTALVLSNLVVLPLMAYAISRLVEHPAATAIEKLRGFLDASNKASSTGGNGNVNAWTAVTNVSGQVAALQTASTTLSESLKKLATVTTNTIPRIADKLAASAGELGLVRDALAAQIPPDAQGNPSTPAQTVVGDILTRMQIQGQNNLRVLRPDGSYRSKDVDVTSDYFLIAKNADGNTIRKLHSALVTIQEAAPELNSHKNLVQSISAASDGLFGPTGNEGVVKSTRDSISALDAAGSSLSEMIETGPAIAAQARAATATLSSVSGFVLPYAFAVLAIGAMLVSIGVTSILRSLRSSDDAHDETVDVGKTLMLSKLALTLGSQGHVTDPLIDRIARIGESPKKGEPSSPLPLARAVGEVAKSLRGGKP